jgi:hypothetical protein
VATAFSAKGPEFGLSVNPTAVDIPVSTAYTFRFALDCSRTFAE